MDIALGLTVEPWPAAERPLNSGIRIEGDGSLRIRRFAKGIFALFPFSDWAGPDLTENRWGLLQSGDRLQAAVHA